MPVMQSNSASEASSLSPSSTIPKFLLKLWSLVNDEATQGIVEWSDDGSCFLIRDQSQLIQLLPYYFKHNNMASFNRQLNIYGFRKVHDNSSSHAQLTNSNTSEASSLSPSSTIPKFLLKPWSLVNDEATQGIVEWSDDGSCFLIRDQSQLIQLLPYYFKHNNMASFSRQLNIYGFRTVHDNSSSHAQLTNSNTLAFAHPNFTKDNPSGLVHIRRKGSNAANGSNSQFFIPEIGVSVDEFEAPFITQNRQVINLNSAPQTETTIPRKEAIVSTEPFNHRTNEKHSEHNTNAHQDSNNSRQQELNELIAIEMRNLSERSEYNKTKIEALQSENLKLVEEVSALKNQQERHELIISRLLQYFFNNVSDANFGMKRKRKYDHDTVGYLESSAAANSRSKVFHSNANHIMQSSSSGIQNRSPTGVMIEELTDDFRSSPIGSGAPSESAMVPVNKPVDILRPSNNHSLPQFATASNSLVPYKSQQAFNKPVAANTNLASIPGDESSSKAPKIIGILKDGKVQPLAVKVIRKNDQQPNFTGVAASKSTVQSNVSPIKSERVGLVNQPKESSSTANFLSHSNSPATSNWQPGYEVQTSSATENILEGSVDDLTPQFEVPGLSSPLGGNLSDSGGDLPPFTPSFFDLGDDFQPGTFNIDSPIAMSEVPLSNLGRDEITFPLLHGENSAADSQLDSVSQIQTSINQNQESLNNLRQMLSVDNGHDKIPSPALSDYLFMEKSGDESSQQLPDLFAFSPGPSSFSGGDIEKNVSSNEIAVSKF